MARSSFSSGVIWRLALRRDLADQDVARLDFGADVDDARFVEVRAAPLRRRSGCRAVISSGPELGVAGQHLELLDVDRGEDVVLHDPLGDQDRVLEVVAVPRHERDEHVAAERELAEVGRRTVGDDVALARPCRPTCTSGRWLMQVFWFERWNFISR